MAPNTDFFFLSVSLLPLHYNLPSVTLFCKSVTFELETNTMLKRYRPDAFARRNRKKKKKRKYTKLRRYRVCIIRIYSEVREKKKRKYYSRFPFRKLKMYRNKYAGGKKNTKHTFSFLYCSHRVLKSWIHYTYINIMFNIF